ncbi:MAG: ATP-binding protein [Oscillospiraceae bacterium]|nr:ATP-binding protein [Oscillospiraceae bacterium]
MIDEKFLRELDESVNRCIIEEKPKTLDYIGDDGLLYCGLCNTPREVVIPFPIPAKMPCMCKCMEDQYNAEQERKAADEKRKILREKKQRAFNGSKYQNATFENDDGKCERLMKLCRNYADRFSMDAPWLILYGDVGVGKSYAAACIVNRLIERGRSARFVTLSQVERNLWDAENKSDVYRELVSCDLLVLDDMGAERKTDYMDEILYNVIDERLRVDKPMIVTTNIVPNILEENADMKMKRVMSRLSEKSAPFLCEGQDRRKSAAKKNAKIVIEGLLSDE